MTGPRPHGPGFEIDSADMELWFHEKTGIGLQSALKIKIERTLFRRRSEIQEVAVLETKGFGRMLVIDGVIMLTELDEAAYHEMIAHVPLLTHPRPARVLVVGGGDGGAVREILKHPEVEKVVLCEIDPLVVQVCQEYLPGLARGLDDGRVEIIHQDGAAYVADKKAAFEVIVVDSPDPFGPAKALFEEPFYASLQEALSPGGLSVSQAESYFFHPQVIKALFDFIPRLFLRNAYYYTQVPTYPSGLIGFAYCSMGPHPLKDLDAGRAAALTGLKHYSPTTHKAAFGLPPRALDLLPEKVRRFQQNLTL